MEQKYIKASDVAVFDKLFVNTEEERELGMQLELF